MSQHKRALVVIITALLLDAVSGIAFAFAEHISNWLGLYWAVTTATTVGYGDISPHTVAGHILAVFTMLTIIPLVSATFALITSGWTVKHVSKHSESLRAHLKHIIEHHPGIPPFEE